MTINHFENKKPHTKIKHKIFCDTFKAILGISAKFSQNNSFSYVDLYAGAGKFDDDTIGSPLLAFETILNCESLQNFHEVKCYFSEKDENSVKILQENIKQSSENCNVHNVFAHIKHGEWSHQDEKLHEILHFSKWGFLFIDPFKNEIELDNLFDLLNHKCKTKDLMIFINTQAIKRTLGLNPHNEKIANFFGVETHELLSISQSDEQIRDALQTRFEMIGKDYILNASLPTTRRNKLVETNYFQLLLITNSIGVANAFLISYVEALNEHTRCNSLDLFNTLEDYLYVVIKKNQLISLNKLVQEIYKNNNSWKNADIHNIPTSHNICKSLNELIRQKKVMVDTKDISLTNKRSGLINSNAYNKNSTMKQVFLRFK